MTTQDAETPRCEVCGQPAVYAEDQPAHGGQSQPRYLCGGCLHAGSPQGQASPTQQAGQGCTITAGVGHRGRVKTKIVRRRPLVCVRIISRVPMYRASSLRPALGQRGVNVRSRRRLTIYSWPYCATSPSAQTRGPLAPDRSAHPR